MTYREKKYLFPKPYVNNEKLWSCEVCHAVSVFSTNYHGFQEFLEKICRPLTAFCEIWGLKAKKKKFVFLAIKITNVGKWTHILPGIMVVLISGMYSKLQFDSFCLQLS